MVSFVMKSYLKNVKFDHNVSKISYATYIKYLSKQTKKVYYSSSGKRVWALPHKKLK